ncbi:MAG: tellurite resistance TerB family protein [Planctomycetota bacterium]
MEDLELLKAAMAVAVADRELRRSEMGVLEGLAKRTGLGPASFGAMVEAARAEDFLEGSPLIQSKEKARSALELLVGLARIDGLISEEERKVLARIATTLDIAGDEFEKIFLAGVQRADEIRRRKGAADAT